MDQKLAAYLLGEMSEAEKARLEDELFADAEKFQQLCAAQDDLLDAYATGQLSPLDRQRFGQENLISPWMRNRARLAEAIAEFAGRTHPFPGLTQPAATKPPWWQSFKSLLWQGTSMWRLAAVSAMALLILAGGWLLLGSLRARSELARMRTEREAKEQIAQQQQRSQLASERARSEQLARALEREHQEKERLAGELAKASPQPSQGKLQTVVSFVLMPQIMRGSGELPKLTIPPGVTRVDLRLSLNEPTQYREYRAELQTAEGRNVSNWTLRPARKAGDGAVTIRVAAGLLESEDYLLMLSGRAPTGDYQVVANYSFRVTKAGRN
jgi:hypothetical protein